MRTISAQEYLELLKDRDLNAIQLVKTRTLFGYKTLHFQLETYANLPESPTFLRVETNDIELDLPPFIEIKEEVTKKAAFRSSNLARTKK